MAESVYIHIPFCANKCHYCDFNSYVVNGQPVMDYLKALDKEMELTVRNQPPNQIKTIFVGGGTPTVLTPTELEYFFKTIHQHFPNLSHNVEFTMEANPGTVELDKLRVMREYGVNRLSMGVQAFQDQLLTYIGRIHSEKEVYESINNAQKIGFDNLSIDLMFGLPNQTLAMLKESLTKAFQLGLPHFSVYSLKVEENTVFHTLYQRNQLPLPSDEDDLNMYLTTMEEMEKHGYKQYEISNFAKNGFESRHNMTYWKNEDYYGLGAGAHGYMSDKRHMNVKGVTPYIKRILEEKKLPIVETIDVSLEEKKEDMLMLGLRLKNGVRFDEYRQAFNEEMAVKFSQQMDKLTKAGLLIKDNTGLRLSKKGIIYGNEVFAEFISI